MRPAFRFFRMFVLRAGFLDGRDGAVVAGLAAASVFVKYVKLRELHRRAARAAAREKVEAAADPLEPQAVRRTRQRPTLVGREAPGEGARG